MTVPTALIAQEAEEESEIDLIYLREMIKRRSKGKRERAYMAQSTKETTGLVLEGNHRLTSCIMHIGKRTRPRVIISLIGPRPKNKKIRKTSL
jgi:hypothetical protein